MDKPSSSPSQRRFQVIKFKVNSSMPPYSPQKRLRLLDHGSSPPPPGTNPELYVFASDSNKLSPSSPVELLSSSIINSPAQPTTLTPEIADIHAELEATTHTKRLLLQAQMTQGKGTEIAYPRQIKAYENFWQADALKRRNNSPGCEVISAQPITVTKVAAYLEYATTRSKRTREGLELAGTTLGRESIKQIVSALENYRKNHQHEEAYLSCPEAQKPLRNDERIRVYEKATKATEAQRLADSHRIKAFGAPSDTYTDDELIRASMFFLQNAGRTRQQIHTGIRDRAMLLISTTTAYRGDNTRRLTWSDLRLRTVTLLDVGPDAKETALVFLSNQGKTNTQGRIDEQAALRHRHPELCVFGALGFYFYSLFHVREKHLALNQPPTDFALPLNQMPDESGARAWYEIRLFPGANGDTSEMSYENHRKRVNAMKMQLNIAISKVTHAGRPYAAITAREHRASRDDTKDLGGWSQSGSYQVYDQTLPIDAMLGAASFNAQKQETYLIARNSLGPPSDLISQIFPWVESEELKRQQRRREHGKNSEDIALKHLLELLVYMRRIIIQDAAALFPQYPDCPLFSLPPFNSFKFRAWAENSSKAIQEAEEHSRMQLLAFPAHVVTSMRGVLTEANIHHRQSINEIYTGQQQIQGQLDKFNNLLEATLPQARSRRTTQRSAPSTTISPTPIILNPPSPAPIPDHDSFPVVVNLSALQTQTISQRGNTYPHTVFPLSADKFEQGLQLNAIEALESRLPAERLCTHAFEWVRKSKDSEWLPRYEWWSPNTPNTSPSVEQIWTEYEHGMDGKLSIRDLNAVWLARWKRNEPRMKSEGSRRQKVIHLVQALAAKPNWNSTLALRFLKELYPIPTQGIPHLKTSRAFIDHLQKKGGTLFQDILTRSDSYP